MDDYYIGTVLLWTGSFVPRNWALCDGTLLNITQNPALYAILGTRYGGDGRTTFQLPDLRNRVPMGLAQVDAVPGPTGAASHPVTVTGAAAGMITANQLPPLAGTASVQVPANNAPVAANTTDVPGPTLVRDKGMAGNGSLKVYTSDNANTALLPFNATVTVAAATAQQPLALPVAVSGAMSTIQPSLTMCFIICVNGFFPPRPD
jgi:microcystin-dependent protein